MKGTKQVRTSHGRRLWRRVVGTSMASVLLLGSGAAALADTDSDGNGNGDGDDGEPSGEGEVEPQLEAPEEDGPCEAFFGMGKTIVVFDDPEFDPGDAEDQIDRFEVAVDVEGHEEPCSYAPEGMLEGNFWEYDDLAELYDEFMSEDAEEYLADLGLSFQAPTIPGYDGVEHVLFLSHPLVEDAVPDSYRLIVDWNYQGVLPLSFVEPLVPWVFATGPILDGGGDLEPSSDGDVLGDGDLGTLDNGPSEEEVEFFENLIGMLETPIVLGPVEVTFDAAWYDVDGESTDAPDDGWEMTLSSDDEVLLTIPEDDDETAQLARRADYTVAGEIPDGWELVECSDDVEATSTGVGDFNAGEQDVAHTVCVAEVEPEVVPIVDEDEEEADEEEDILPETGVAPLGLLALGAGMTFAGVRMTRRRD